MPNGVEYSLTFANDSCNGADVCIYQEDPDLSNSRVMSLAWFTKFAWPTTRIKFTWTLDYSFVWDRTGTLEAGVVFNASQDWGANLSTTNQVTLTYDENAFTFRNQTAGGRQGSLYITEDGTIPLQVGSVGIGMSGAGTFVSQAQPNWELVFTPHPTYWITFGNYTQGQVLDTLSISNAAEIQFPDNVYDMNAILNRNNTWTIEQAA